MSFFGLVITVVLVAIAVQAALFARYAFVLNNITGDYYASGSAIRMQIYAGLASGGLPQPYLNLSAAMQGISIACENGTYAIIGAGKVYIVPGC